MSLNTLPNRLFLDGVYYTAPNDGTVEANIVASKTNLLSFSIFSTSTDLRYFMLFDSTTAPVLGSTPVQGGTFAIVAGSAFIKEYINTNGRLFSNGLSFGWSLTKGTYTTAGTNDFVLELLRA